MLQVFKKIKNFFHLKPQVFIEDLQSLEEVLFSSDMSPRMVEQWVSQLKEKINRSSELTLNDVKSSLREIMQTSLKRLEKEIHFPHLPSIIMVVGINGVGKTTTIIKLANYFQLQGKKTLIVAADTFRAAAIDQLNVWGEKLGLSIFSGAYQADPSSVVFEAMTEVRKNVYDIVLVDTAGRMHVDKPLMVQLEKMKKVVYRSLAKFPDETWIVVDAHMGLNVLNQILIFHQSVPLTGLIMSKMDGLAKGGILFSLNELSLRLPVLFLGMGEKETDIIRFYADAYLEQLFKKSNIEIDASH